MRGYGNQMTCSIEALGGEDEMVGQKELIGLLVRRAGVTAWIYEAQKDCLTYCRPDELVCLNVSGFKNGKVSAEWGFLWSGKSSGFTDVHDTPWQKDGNYRLTFLRIRDGKDVVGFAEKLDGEMDSDLLSDINLDKLTTRINTEMMLLHPREKGVLFVMEASAPTKKTMSKGDRHLTYVDILEQAIRSEFRGQDILSRLSGTRYLVFFRGELPIDIIEHRAQTFLDEFARLALDSMIPTVCSIGIAVTGKELISSKDLIAAAGQALDEAIDRGSNHYRMFENTRY